jgi:hypothetical protein
LVLDADLRCADDVDPPMPLTLSIHPITGTRQSAPNLDGLLRDAAVQVARTMSRELAVLFGVGCTDVRVRSAFGEAVELRHRSDEALERDVRGFVRHIAMGRHGAQVASDPAVVGDLALWERARTVLVNLLRSNRDIELSNVSRAPGRAALISYERTTGAGTLRMNPFTWARRNPAGRGDPQAWLRMGPVMLLLHETRHHSGCFLPQDHTCRASTGAGLIAHESDAVEEATIADINEVGLTLELPSRTGHRASPGDVTRLRYADGRTVDLRWPTLPQLLGGHF